MTVQQTAINSLLSHISENYFRNNNIWAGCLEQWLESPDREGHVEELRVRVRAELLPKVAVTPSATIAMVCARKWSRHKAASGAHRLSVS